MGCRDWGLRALAVTCALLPGCASLDPTPDWRRVQALVSEGDAPEPLWRRTPEEDAEARTLVTSLLEDGLTRKEAVRIALVNDPRLQAQFDQLGQTRADYVQAGLFTNPELGAFIGFPISLDASAVTLLGFLSDLWIAPARQAVAEVTLQAMIQQAAAAALQTLFEAEQTYDMVLYQDALLAIERDELELRRRSATRLERTSKRERERIRESAMKAGIGDQEIAFAQAVRDLAVARHHLAQVLDLRGAQAEVPLVETLSEPPEDAWSEERAVRFALERRLDLAAARLGAEQARRRAALARRSRISQVGTGPGYNGAFGKDDNWGPTVALTVPIFDWKQADLASAHYQEIQSHHLVEALEAQTRREIGDAMAERQLQRSQAEILRFEVGPERQRLRASAGPDGPADFAEYLQWLQAQEDEIDTRRDYVTAVWHLRQSHTDFLRALYAGSVQPR